MVLILILVLQWSRPAEPLRVIRISFMEKENNNGPVKEEWEFLGE